MDQRSVQDRASGSGVFARDPDAQLDLTPLDISNVKYDTDTAYLMACTAWKMESVLREFASFQPIKLWFAYPIHIADSEVGNLLLGAKAKKPGGKQKGSGLNKETIDTAIRKSGVSGRSQAGRSGRQARYVGTACEKDDKKPVRRFVPCEERHRFRGLRGIWKENNLYIRFVSFFF